MAGERRAEVTWKGTLAQGGGTLRLASGATGELPVTWASRTERSAGKTSPEELIAAAHASCFSMALSAGLGDAGTPPAELHTTATCSFEHGDDGFRVTKMHLDVRGKVPGVDAGAFAAAAEEAKVGCPMAKVLTGIPEVTVSATLE